MLFDSEKKKKSLGISFPFELETSENQPRLMKIKIEDDAGLTFFFLQCRLRRGVHGGVTNCTVSPGVSGSVWTARCSAPSQGF